MCYVGITSYDPKVRWKNGKGYQNQKEFGGAIEKFGWDNFEHIILENYLTMDEASKYEEEYIKKFDSLVGHNGYNVRTGGYCGPNSGKKITAFDKNYNHVCSYNSMREASKIQCRESIGKSINNKSFTDKGYIWFLSDDLVNDKIPEEIIPLIDRSNLLEPIYQFDFCRETKTVKFIREFNNYREVCDEYNMYSSNLYDVLKNETLWYGKMFKYKKDVPDINMFEKTYVKTYKKRECKHLYRISYTREVIEYNSIFDACEALCIDEQNNVIRQCCLGSIPSAYGYIWKYTDDVEDLGELLANLDYSILEKHIEVLQFSKNGKYMKEYKNAFDAYIQNKDLFSHKNASSERILLSCRGKIKSAAGYIWIFKCNINTIEKRVVELMGNKNSKSLIQFTIDGKEIKRYKSSNQAEHETGIKKANITAACNGKDVKTANGYIWLYEDDYITNPSILLSRIPNCIIQLDNNFNIVNIHNSVNQAYKNNFGKNAPTFFYDICTNGLFWNNYFWTYERYDLRGNDL